MLDFMFKYGVMALAVLGGLTALVAAITPLTKTDADDKLLKALVWLHDMLVKLVPNAASKPAAPARPVNSVRDHREP